MGNTVQVDAERLVKVETRLDQQSGNITEIKSEIVLIRETLVSTTSSLAVMVEISKQNQKRDDEMKPEIQKIKDDLALVKAWQFKAAGIMAAALFIASMFGSEIKAAIGL